MASTKLRCGRHRGFQRWTTQPLDLHLDWVLFGLVAAYCTNWPPYPTRVLCLAMTVSKLSPVAQRTLSRWEGVQSCRCQGGKHSVALRALYGGPGIVGPLLVGLRAGAPGDYAGTTYVLKSRLTIAVLKARYLKSNYYSMYVLWLV